MARSHQVLPFTAGLLTTTLLLSSTPTAQGGAYDHQSLKTAPRHATLELQTGELNRDGGKSGVPLVTIWANTDYAGYYAQPNAGEEWLDWGIITTTSGSDIVGRFTFAYATTALSTTVGGPGANLCTSFYSGALGFCSESGLGLLPDAAYCFSGLPGTSTTGVPAGWILTVTLTGGLEFELGAGSFGLGLSDHDGVTGPLLCYAGSGSTDAFDIYVPDVATGTCTTFWFGGGASNYSAFYLSIEAADGRGGPWATSTSRNGTGVNPASYWATPPILGGTIDTYIVPPAPHLGALLAGFVNPTTITTPWGELLVDVTSLGGELLGLPSGFGRPVTISLPVPINLALCGVTIHSQALAIGGGFQLLNAVELLVGF